MTDTDNHKDLPIDEQLAAEFALGVLSGTERHAAERKLTRDPEFAALVSQWQERLAPLASEVAPVPPHPALWDRITAAIGEPASALPADSPATAAPGLWQNLAFWRGFGLISAGLAAVCLAIVVYLNGAGRQAPLVAALEANGKPVFSATIDAARGTVLIVPATFAIEPGKVPELWIIPPGDKPHSLGLLSPDKAVMLSIPGALLDKASMQTVLAVSIEPQGGSTTGAPTGPVIASGKLTKL